MDTPDKPVMTVLEARVAPEQWGTLQTLYQGAHLPSQMLQAFLVQSADDPAQWRGVSIWRSRAALEEYRRSVETPGGVAMFRAAGAEPTLARWTVVTALPHG
jgi:quinol monooxygenase YgiN